MIFSRSSIFARAISVAAIVIAALIENTAAADMVDLPGYNSPCLRDTQATCGAVGFNSSIRLDACEGGLVSIQMDWDDQSPYEFVAKSFAANGSFGGIDAQFIEMTHVYEEIGTYKPTYTIIGYFDNNISRPAIRGVDLNDHTFTIQQDTCSSARTMSVGLGTTTVGAFAALLSYLMS